MRLAELCGLCHVLRPRGSLLAPLPSRLLVGWESAHGSPCSSPTDVLPSPPIPLSQQLKASQQEEAGKDATKISVSSNRGSDEVCAWGHRSPQRGTHCTEHRGLLHPGALSVPITPTWAAQGPAVPHWVPSFGESGQVSSPVLPIQWCSWDQNEETPISSIKHVLLAVCCCLALLRHPSKRAKRCWAAPSPTCTVWALLSLLISGD